MALILVVEDENYVQIFIREALEDAGHEVALARSGKEASLLCRERDFDLIITDILMPEMDGLELIRSLHRSHSQLPPILAISGAYEGALKIAERFGAAGILKKPFGPDELFATVDKILRKEEQR
jgi:DNA-binding response OmpR family regulator